MKRKIVQTGSSLAVTLPAEVVEVGANYDDLLLQTAGFFDYTVIVEEGFSYKKFTESLGETPIVVHPDAPLTLNYLDTQGLPLTQLHLATAVALLARMVGEPETAEQLALRQAQLTQYLHQLYRDTFAD